MEKMMVVIFDNEKCARRAVKYLEILHYDGEITLYANAVIKKDPEEIVSVVQSSDRDLLGTSAGMITGSLIGILGGPVGVAVGMLAGSLGGITYDLTKMGVNREFLDHVEHRLLPGKVALVADVQEDQPERIDVQLKALGGIPMRWARSEVIGFQIERDFTELDAEILELEAEVSNANELAKVKLKAKLDAAKAKLSAYQDKAKATLANAKREEETDHAERKDRVEGWIADRQIELEKRLETMRRSLARSRKAAENWRYVQTHV